MQISSLMAPTRQWQCLDWSRRHLEHGLPTDASRTKNLCVTGHLAFRGLVSQHDLPAYLRSRQVTVALGEKPHVVQYRAQGALAQWWPLCEGAIEGRAGLEP